MAFPIIGEATINADALIATVAQLVQATNSLSSTMKAALPVVQSTATSATAGAQTLPANPAGFLLITLPNGTAAKVPYYNV